MPIRDLMGILDRRRTGPPLTVENLEAASVAESSSPYFRAVDYIGKPNGYGLGVGFEPDMVWIKSRTAVTSHFVYDSVREATRTWNPDSTAVESIIAQGLTAFHSNGFNVGTNTGHNDVNGVNAFLAWAWLESPAAGLDIISYIGNGTTQNIAHDLGVVPDLIIVKRRGVANAATVYHSGLTTPGSQFLLLNGNALPVTDSTVWGGALATSASFSVGSSANTNASGNTYIAYAFAGKAGFSAISSYTGNGSVTGPGINTGFNPQLVIIRRASGNTGSWRFFTRVRGGANSLTHTTAAEAATAGLSINFLSTGFQPTGTNSDINTSGNRYLYMAWA